MTNNKSHVRVGILGGMGPYATLSFWKKILDKTEAQKDWHHIHVIIDNHTKIPSRTRHILYNEASPVPDMISACQKLASYPVDFITIPCNSASYYIKDITPHCDTEIINIIEVASKSIRNHSPTAKSALVLGGRTTYAKKSYQPFLQAEGISYIDLDEEDQMIVETIIEHIKLRPDARDIPDKLSKMMKHIRDRYQPDVIILGCTEFGCLTSSSVPETLIIDSSDELANYIIDIARKK